MITNRPVTRISCPVLVSFCLPLLLLAAGCWLLLKIRSASLCLCGARGSSDKSGVLLRGTCPLPAYISAFFAYLVCLIWSCFCVALLCSCCDAACGTFN